MCGQFGWGISYAIYLWLWFQIFKRRVGQHFPLLLARIGAKSGLKIPSAEIPSELAYPLGFTVYFRPNVRKWRERTMTVRDHSAFTDVAMPSRVPTYRHAAERTVAIGID